MLPLYQRSSLLPVLLLQRARHTVRHLQQLAQRFSCRPLAAGRVVIVDIAWLDRPPASAGQRGSG